MSVHPSLNRRQQWALPSTGISNTIGEWAIHFRFLGVNPTIPNDLIASMLLCLTFGALIGGCTFVGRQKECRTIGLYTLFVASIFFFLAFAIRAGISNSTNPKKSSFIAECLFLVFGQLCVFDAWMMRLKDELIDFHDHSKRVDLRGPDGFKGVWIILTKHHETRLAIFNRVIVSPLCIILYIIGYSTIPDPSIGSQTASKNATRGIASFSIIAMLCAMQLVTLRTACFEQPPWLPFLIIFGTSFLLWLPAGYAFCLVATTTDTASFVRSKTFFYFSFGFAHLLAIAALVAMHRQKPALDSQAENLNADGEKKEAADENA